MNNIESNKIEDYLDHVFTIKQFFNRHRSGGYTFAVSYSYPLKKEVNREVIEYAKEQNLTIGEVSLDFDTNKTCVEQLKDAKRQFINGIILTNIDELMLLTQDEFAYQINGMREALFTLHIPILIWLMPENHNAFTYKAIDLYTRRDLETLFFPEIKSDDINHLIERSEMQLGQEENSEILRTRIVLLEKQLEAARKDEIPRPRIAKEIVFPLIKAYHQLLFLEPAIELMNEFEDEFNDTKQRIYTEFGKINHQAGNLDIALQFFEKALNQDIKLFGKDAIEVGNGYNDLALVWKDKKDLDKAMSLTEKALNITLKVLGDNNEATAASYNNIAVLLKEKGDLSKAPEYSEKALSMEKSFLGKIVKELRLYIITLPQYGRKKGNLDKALDYYERSLKIELKLFGTVNQNVAVRYNNLGLIWSEKNNLKKAVDYYEKAIEINKKLFGEESINIAFIYNNLAYIYEKSEKIENAMILWNKAFNILYKTYGPDHDYTKSLKFKIDQYKDIYTETM